MVPFKSRSSKRFAFFLARSSDTVKRETVAAGGVPLLVEIGEDADNGTKEARDLIERVWMYECQQRSLACDAWPVSVDPCALADTCLPSQHYVPSKCRSIVF